MTILEEKNRKLNGIITIGVFLMVMNCFLSGLGIYGSRTSPPLLVALLLACGLYFGIFLWMKKVSWISKRKVVLLEIMGVSYLIFGVIFFTPTYLLYGGFLCVLFPMFCIVSGNEIWNHCIPIFCKIYTGGIVVIIVACIIFAPISLEQYEGVFNNPNLLGGYLSVAIVSILYLMLQSQKRSIQYGLICIFAFTVAVILFSQSRTATVSLLFSLFVSTFFLLKNRRFDMKIVIRLVAAVLIATPVLYYVLLYVTPEISGLFGIAIETQYQINNMGVLEYLMESQRYLKGITDEGSLSSGRMEIWRTYINELSFWGHSGDDLTVYYSGQETKTNAHNSIIQAAYQAGIITGIVFVILLASISVYHIKRVLIEKNYSGAEFFMFVSLGVAGIWIMLANPFSPYVAAPLFAYWFVVLPQFMTNDQGKVLK